MDDPKDHILPRLDPDEAGYLRDELDSLRALVTRGTGLAVAGGRLMAWWGLCLCVQYVAFAGAAAGLWHEGRIRYGLTFLVVAYAGHFTLSWIARRQRRLPVFRTWRTQAISTVWLFVGIALILISLGQDITGHGDENVMCAFASILFAIVQGVIASAGQRGWMFVPAIGWMAMSVACYTLADMTQLYGAFAMACAFLLVVPGLILWWMEAHQK